MHRGNAKHTQNWDEPDTACVRIECMSDRKGPQFWAWYPK